MKMLDFLVKEDHAPMIAQALRLHETSIIRHIDDYLKKEKLKPENGGSSSYLSIVQTEDVISI